MVSQVGPLLCVEACDDHSTKIFGYVLKVQTQLIAMLCGMHLQLDVPYNASAKMGGLV